MSKDKDILAKRVGFLCSNPKCKKLTCGPREETTKVVNIGVAAHITAASTKGPRYNSFLTNEERCSINNGIWLCQNCAKLIDNDQKKYNESLLIAWKTKAENYARSLLESTFSTDLNWQGSLSQQLTTFSRVPFSLPGLPLDNTEFSSLKELIRYAAYIVFRMMACAYLETSSLIKRDNFIFGLTFNREQDDNNIYLSGELITHLTPFAYRFGILAKLLNNNKLDELLIEMDEFPAIDIRRQLVFGTLVPFKISRVNPAKIFIESAFQKVYTFKGDLSTSDLIYYFGGGVNGSILLFDEQNEIKGANKNLRLMNETMDGFDLLEIWINPDNPEDWAFN